MTENHESLPEPGDEPILDEALSHLKRLQPPLESRIANRAAVATALDELNAVKQRSQLPWWRRSIAVPVPVAASVLLLTTLAVSANFRGGREQLPLQVSEQDKQSSIAQRVPRSRAELKYYETETYLCGIGRVSSESHYSLEE
jgi:hypothetical protein